jgi:cellobiose-specific phosphotransferase system component IIB
MNNIREHGVSVNKDQKIRITKNHTVSITDEYINSVLSRNPEVAVEPNNSTELSDIKDAQLSNSVLSWVKSTNKWSKKRPKVVHDTVVVGESYATVAFDYSKGRVAGLDENGKEVLAGEMVIQMRMAYDTKRDPQAKSFEDCRFVFFDKLMDKKEAIELVKSLSPDNVDKIKDAQSGDTTIIFDSSTGSYAQTETARVHIIEMYVRPCTEYPKGQFIIMTKDFEIYRMDLPLGIFCVYQSGHAMITDTPRYSAVMRVIRPYQIEINRASSKMAEHQITLGDDKMVLFNGSKIKGSAKESGIRVVSVDGSAPLVVAGRTGEQYLNYVINEVNGMYQAANVAHLLEDKQITGDPFMLLFSTMKQKAKFVNYVGAYEEFEKEMFSDILKLCKYYLDESHLIKIVGRTEYVNIAEFKDVDLESMDVKVVASNGDIETKFGKVLTLTQVLQYAGSSLSPDQIGTIVKQLPYGNKDEIFSPLTINYDTAVNIILSLDRGEMPKVPKYGDTDYLLRAIQSRTVKADFILLAPQVQQNYDQVIQQLEQTKSAQELQIQQAAAGMIPSGGFLTTVNASWQNPSTGKVERIKIPSDAISWLAQKLNQQGTFVRELESQSPQVQAEISNNVVQMNNPQQAPQVQGV